MGKRRLCYPDCLSVHVTLKALECHPCVPNHLYGCPLTPIRFPLVPRLLAHTDRQRKGRAFLALDLKWFLWFFLMLTIIYPPIFFLIFECYIFNRGSEFFIFWVWLLNSLPNFFPGKRELETLQSKFWRNCLSSLNIRVGKMSKFSV